MKPRPAEEGRPFISMFREFQKPWYERAREAWACSLINDLNRGQFLKVLSIRNGLLVRDLELLNPFGELRAGIEP